MTLRGINWATGEPMAEGAFDIFAAGAFKSCVVMSIMGPELPREIRRRYPEATIIARLYCDGDGLPDIDTINAWDGYIKAVLPYTTLFQVDNEPDERCPNIFPEEYCLYWRAMVKSFRVKYPTAQFGFPMPSIKGAVSWAYARRCQVGVDAADWLAERAYAQEAWQWEDVMWARRYQRSNFFFDKPIHLCEIGSSNPNLSEAERVTQYESFLGSLPFYIGSANLFIMAGSGEWDPIFGINADMARAMRRGEPVPEDDGYSIGPGMFEAMERNGDAPVEEEHYIGDRESLCAGEKNLYIYSAGAGRVYKSPLA